MTTLDDALARFRGNPLAKHPDNPFRLVSTVSAPALAAEVAAAWRAVPSDAEALWSACRDARLFEDADYGQWGLVLLDPHSSALRTTQERAARPTEYREGDVVIGAFLGDQELLVIAPDGTGSRRILVALPLDGRSEWFGAASSLAEFIERYFDAGGNKFWEARYGSEP